MDWCWTIGLWAALASVIGCGSDRGSSSAPSAIDIAGIYAVTHHTRNVSDCDSEGAEQASFTHFQAVGSGSGFSVVECGSADPASCPTPSDAAFNGQLIAAFDTPEK